MYLFLLLFFSTALTIAQTPTQSGIVHTAEVDLAYEVFGSSTAAIPLIAINGGPGFPHTYFRQNDVFTTRLARDRRVVLYDQRGTGQSHLLNPNAPQDMNAQVADLEALRNKLGVDKVILLGHSWGGLVSMAYITAHPEHVAKLILVDSIAPSWDKTIFLFSSVYPDLTERDEQIKQTDKDPVEVQHLELEDHYQELFYSPENHDRYMATLPDPGKNYAVNEAVYNATKDLDYTDMLPKFTVPTLVMHGRFDVNVGMLNAWTTYKAIPNAKIVIFRKSGHFPFYEEPDKFTTELTIFLAS